MTLQIPCPKCGAFLKLRDRSMLGRTGKCPKCSHRFTLTEPDEVELELASEADEPLKVGTARRVPRGARTTAEPVSSSPLPEVTTVADSAASASGVERLRALKRARARQQRIQIVVGAVVALAVAGAMWAGVRYAGPERPAPGVAEDRPPQENKVYLSERDRLEQQAKLIAADSPTRGEPISLRYVPHGASIVVHLRPAALWKPESTGEEIRFCLGGELQTWIDEQIQKHCLLPPSEIAEATICILLGARGSEPLVAAVVRPATPLKTSELIRRFEGEPRSINGVQVYVGSERAALIGSEYDEQKRPMVFATAPASLADDLADVANKPGITSEGVRGALEHTDRERDLTIVFQPSDLRVHEQSLVREDLRSLWSQMLDRFGDDAEAVAWSLHVSEGDFVSELLVRNDPSTTPTEVKRKLERRLEQLPIELVSLVSRLEPAEVGRRKLLSRLPAMVQLYAAATVTGIESRRAVIQTRLPERAGPNLALGGLLAWHESMRAGSASPSPKSSDSAPIPLAQRLKKPVDVDFRRMPLEEAFAFIGAETGIKFDIDGDSLKLAAYTRNMPQTLSLGRVPAEKAIAAILAQYDKMVVVLDDRSDKALVTTVSFAEEQGLSPATFSP